MLRAIPTTLLAGLLLLSACAATAAVDGEVRRPSAVAKVDLEKYMGRWYEIARYPNSYQKGTVGVVAHYQLRDNGRITLKNSARKKTLDGSVKTGSGSGKVDRRSNGATWDVTFIWPFTADYWIIELDPEYRWAVVGQPSRKNLWILSRSPVLDKAVYDDIVGRLEKHGYDKDKLEATPQPKDGPTFKPGEDGKA